ncbi:MAG: glutamine-synthetase adenylyltransferase [Bryobacteraceae bacterium]|nr:glutamine-synthetase adenylyltransferase [Bryobacteraceae bacterium]
MAEIVEHPEWLQDLVARGDLHRAVLTEELIAMLEAEAGPGVPSALPLARFRRRQLLRVLLRDVLGLGTLAEITGELSAIAGAIVEFVCTRLCDDLGRRFGQPCYLAADATRRHCGFAVIALGKLGGEELNYSSDIDLMFLYGENGETDGASPVSNKEFYKRIANQLTAILSTYTTEGLCYRVDLRLRPEGSLGEVCISLDGARRYYSARARDWELQMLIKARVIAGDQATGRALLDFVEPLTYSTSLDFSAIETMSVTRERLNEKLAARKLNRKSKAIDVKLARGGIRDIEFLVQCLQRLHGGREAWVRHGGSLLALSRLHDKGLLSDAEYGQLAAAYQFLRNLEHRLQFDEDRQTHTLPDDPGRLDVLARKMPMPSGQSVPVRDGAWLSDRLHAHFAEVTEIYERVVHAQRHAAEPESPAPKPGAPPAPGNIMRSLDLRAPNLAAMVRLGLSKGLRSFEHFLERVAPDSPWIGELEGDENLARRVLDLFEHSPYLAEQLIRFPEMVDGMQDLDSPWSAAWLGQPTQMADSAELRRVFRRHMFRIQAESICIPSPVFETLQRNSELADWIISAAYQTSVAEVLVSRPPSATYVPVNRMMVVTLGRLGMHEFDVGSDADLVFVLPDEDRAELQFWTRVAERIIDILTAYTREGVVFAVDTRLRPNGREGELVQTAGSVLDYFENQAEAWEGIAYMKSRAVAGDIERATLFLHRLQEVDWRRYGQSGRSRKDLREMRMKLQKEQGAANPLKAGAGGYYDIDFLLMYLRLKSAGIFFRVLNTPERIDVIEQMGHLDRADAAFLRDAATFYRALDHGLRLTSGQAEGTLPHSEAQLETLMGLLSRWTPDHLHDEPLAVELDTIRARTRALFDRVFV